MRLILFLFSLSAFSCNVIPISDPDVPGTTHEYTAIRVKNNASKRDIIEQVKQRACKYRADYVSYSWLLDGNPKSDYMTLFLTLGYK